MGTDREGESCDVRISVEELAKRITFTERKFRGFTVGSSTDGDTCIIKVEPIVPIIDGAIDKEGME
jgi:hypothetical protein